MTMSILRNEADSKDVGDQRDIALDRRPSTPRTDSRRESQEEPSDTESAPYYNRIGLAELTPIASHGSQPSLHRRVTGVSTMTTATTDPAFEIDFDEDDLENPQNWSLLYKAWIVASISFSTTTVVFYSSSYTAGIPGMIPDLDVPQPSDTIAVLGLTTYLLGLAVGSVILAPLSEMFGRRPVYIISLAVFTLLVIPCALAKDIWTILVVRFIAAIAGSAPISNSPGTINDIVREEYRALAFSIWSIGPMNGPVLGPLCAGWIFQEVGWRWIYWVTLICGAIGLAMNLAVAETYAPAILRKRASAQRKESNDNRWYSRYDEKVKLWPLLKINLSRPFWMTFTEPILIFWDLYIALVYAILYLSFVAYPIIFSGLRHWSPGFTGLAYLGIGVGNLITIVSEPLLRRIINSHKRDPETGRVTPEAMVSVICIAAVLIPIGELWFAWTCTPNVHWIWPILAGIPFGAGNGGIFIYGVNYIVHSYGIYAASALAGNAVLRSVVGGTLPLAGAAMYKALGANWAGTMLGCMELACVPIPFVFYKYGYRIRMKSKLISRMQKDKTRLEAKRQKALEKQAKNQEHGKDVEMGLEKRLENLVQQKSNSSSEQRDD